MTTTEHPTDRNPAIKTIRAALKRRSGRMWSVTGGTGTSWGWITISAPPARRDNLDRMTENDARELGELLGLGRPTQPQGVDIPAGCDYRQEYIDRAEGRKPTAVGVQYWD